MAEPDSGRLVAEKSVLGSMMRWSDVIGEVVLEVREEDFYASAHRRVFAALVALYENGNPTDMVSVAEELRRRGHVEDVSYSYLGELFQSSPTGAEAVYHAGIVRGDSLRRRLVQAGNEIARDAADHVARPDELLEQAERRIFSIQQRVTGQTVSLETAVGEACERYDARARPGGNQASGVPTGFVDLDNVLGGLQNSELIVLAARPSLGKTALAVAICRNALRNGFPVFFVSLEQSRAELTDRLLCSAADIDTGKYRRGTLNRNEVTALCAARDVVRRYPMTIDDSPVQSMLHVAANARRLKLRQDVKLVVVDYLQLVEPEDRRASRHEQVGSVSRRLKQLARELKAPVLALAQLSRAAEDRPEPRLADLRESGSIEADADAVLLLSRPQKDQDLLSVSIAKNRNGPIGDAVLVFHKNTQRFENYAADL